jgi:glycosyltransferase involved in cell wall biosynthesis
MTAFSLTVFFPAYNDALSLPELLDKTFDVLECHVADFEVVIVNDGSTDNTAEVVRILQERHGPRLRVVTHEKNLGYGAALRSGFTAARKEVIFYTDGDGQYDVEELPLLLKQMTSGVGLVNGFKIARSDPWYRSTIGSVYRGAVRRLFGLSIRDVDCDFRLIRRSSLENIELISTSGAICAELVYKLERSGARAAEVPVHHYRRLYGQSQFFRVGPLFSTLRQLTALFFSRMARG